MTDYGIDAMGVYLDLSMERKDTYILGGGVTHTLDGNKRLSVISTIVPDCNQSFLL